MRYANELQGCLTSIDVKMLNKATRQFERKLNEHFGEENLNENYISFLSALSELNGSPKFSRDFFFNKKSIELINDFEKNGLSPKIWIPYVEESSFEDEVPITTSGEFETKQERTPDFDVLKPNGEFVSCVLSSNINQNLSNVLNKITKLSGVSPTLTSTILKSKMKSSDFDNELNKVVVAIVFYFDIVNTLNKNRG